ncbi:hypothetical protein WJX81_002693 [Elliptochloris bilobata]|uniref:Glycoside hydrolase family 5 domain-containing protein n=1 Tax=Elliptochloris bilobata TaxID=381761 RepID=A0AAW1SCY4_9CHLO
MPPFELFSVNGGLYLDKGGTQQFHLKGINWMGAGVQLLPVVRYASHWNVFAAVLKNEPHGKATWGTDDPATDWRLAAERIGAAVQAMAPRLLVFVEGVQGTCDNVPRQQLACWGGALDSAGAAPVRLPVPNKVVYSPLLYGPDVQKQGYFNESPTFDNLPGEVWQHQWAYLGANKGPAVVLGEWGGHAVPGTPDNAWHERLAQFLIDRGMTDNFYWCLNPTSTDTGGVLDNDWTTPIRHKLDRLARMNSSPSRLVVDGNGNLQRVDIGGSGASTRIVSAPRTRIQPFVQGVEIPALTGFDRFL